MARDVIPDSDVRLIKAHIANHGVTRVAQGVYGNDPYAHSGGFYSNTHARRAKKMAERRIAVRLRVAKGETYESLAEAFKVSVCTIENDVRALKD